MKQIKRIIILSVLVLLIVLLSTLPAIQAQSGVTEPKKLTPLQSQYSEGPKECNSSIDCGTPYWQSLCKKVVVIPKCVNGFCTGRDSYIVEDFAKEIEPDVIHKAEQYLKDNYGESFFNEHFMLVDVPKLSGKTTKEIDINLSEVIVNPDKTALTMQRPFWYILRYNISWVVDNETLTLTSFDIHIAPLFSMDKHEFIDLEVDEQFSDKLKEAKEILISRDEAEEIAKKYGFDISSSSIEFWSKGWNIEGYKVPAWRVNRVLTREEIGCKTYLRNIVIDAFSGEVIEKFYSNPCYEEVGARKSDVDQNTIKGYIIFVIVIVGILGLIILILKKKEHI